MVADRTKKRILIVDDEASIRRLVIEILKDEGYEFTTARSGPEAIRRFEPGAFHLVILDLKMPEMDGVSVLKRLREEDPHVSVLLMTAYGTVESAAEALKGGAYDFVSKSFEDLNLFKKKIDEGLKRSEEARVRVERRLQREKLAALGEAAAKVSHDLKNPLAVIDGFVQLLPIKYQDEKFRQKFIETLTREAGRLKAMANDLLTFSQTKRLNRTPISLPDLLQEAVESCLPEIEKKKLVLRKTIPDRTTITADRDGLLRVFVNLIQNAVHAVDAGGRLKIGCERNGPGVRVTFEDNGCGIPRAELGRIFEPFHTTKKQGTGLGLAIAKSVIEAHEGELRVESHVGKGTCFTIYLPSRGQGVRS